jgi:glycogen synthase
LTISKTITPEEIFLTANLNILWLTENYPPQRGGMAVSCDRIVRTLREKSATIDVAHFSSRYIKWKTEQKIGGTQFSCPVREDISHALNRFWNLIENKKYTHVAAFGGLLPMLASPVFAAWLKAPLITLIRGNDFDAGIFSLKRGDILREALKNSAYVCAVSRDKVEKISRLYPQAGVAWTPNGINSSDWEFSEFDKKTARKWRAENVPENLRVLGLFGHLKRKKGGLFFLENLLRSGHAEKFHLLLVGDAEPEMAEWLETNREKVSFTHLQFLDRYELLPFYAACDFVVIPSFYDGMPNVLLEAAALGIPALASNAGGMRDVLKNLENSVLFEAGDEYSCRNAIEQAANLTDDEIKKLSKNCLALAEKFNHETEAERYLQIFNETSERRSFYAEK